MHDVPDRPFTKADACLLVASIALGIAWAWASWPILQHIYLGIAGYSGPLARNPILFALHLASTAMTPPTLMMVVLGWRGHGSGRRSGFRKMGVASCIAASAVILGEVARYPVRLFTLYQSLTRAQGDLRSNILQYPRMPNSLGLRTLAGSVAHDVGPHVGVAVLGVWLVFWASKISSPGSCWLDRIGRIVAVFWIAVAVGFLFTPIS